MLEEYWFPSSQKTGGKRESMKGDGDSIFQRKSFCHEGDTKAPSQQKAPISSAKTFINLWREAVYHGYKC